MTFNFANFSQIVKLVLCFVPNCLLSEVMNRHNNRILVLFFISLITALPGSNGDDTSKDSLTVNQDVTLGIEEINELARQLEFKKVDHSLFRLKNLLTTSKSLIDTAQKQTADMNTVNTQVQKA